jgi:hypothetical protein
MRAAVAGRHVRVLRPAEGSADVHLDPQRRRILGLQVGEDGDDADKLAAGHEVTISLKYVGKDHKPSKYVVYTAYLEG